MRYQHNIRKANRRFMITTTALGLMVIALVLAFSYAALRMG